MLVLRRKIGESIVLAGTITVTVLDIERDRIKIGIAAPPAITIAREELLLRDQEKRKESESNDTAAIVDKWLQRAG